MRIRFPSLILTLHLFILPLFNNMDALPPQLSVASINCNSLNMSSIGKDNHLLKIHGIVSLNTDVILLSDIRLCNSAGVSNINEITNTLRCNPYCAYRLISNSKRNKRGVGILIKKNSPFAVIAEKRDREENILILRIRHTTTGKEFLIGSIYGPNKHEPRFFLSLRELIADAGAIPVVLGGDWNCTYSNEPASSYWRHNICVLPLYKKLW